MKVPLGRACQFDACWEHCLTAAICAPDGYDCGCFGRLFQCRCFKGLYACDPHATGSCAPNLLGGKQKKQKKTLLSVKTLRSPSINVLHFIRGVGHGHVVESLSSSGGFGHRADCLRFRGPNENDCLEISGNLRYMCHSLSFPGRGRLEINVCRMYAHKFATHVTHHTPSGGKNARSFPASTSSV